MISQVLNKLKFCYSDNECASEFSVQEITAIKDVWSRARNIDVGEKILGALIEKKPNFAEYYGFQTSLAVEELKKGTMFILQARRIQNFLDTIVSTLGFCPDATIHHMAYRIGQIHYHRGVNFGADNWLVFKKVTIDQVLAALKRPSSFNDSPNQQDMLETSLNSLRSPSPGKNNVAVIGWNRLMSLVIREMKRGFLDEAIRNCEDDSNENT
ncbi:hypothetical protein KIN20_033030 [Parelaphostrongylus tenuis]|uniref:Globin family profile domain-containing protein n=1 Tax=Parelaphostrongylus tenuis TaxID=148309 RepID=A0AAD5R9M8_PARTN|nr:hypothetical protein KIN20_033030 [Parelaphostrongylus tenuis]